MDRETILSDPRDIHDLREKKADHACLGECAAQTGLSEAQSELDRRVWRMHANPLIDQTRREKCWQCDELEMRNKAFQEDRARICKEIEE